MSTLPLGVYEPHRGTVFCTIVQNSMVSHLLPISKHNTVQTNQLDLELKLFPFLSTATDAKKRRRPDSDILGGIKIGARGWWLAFVDTVEELPEGRDSSSSMVNR
ncbi:hypothetical protein BDP27DRAFT_1412569 [Rhodocollybia butyracea]|uniref:Uncharacterized protein n=1 Tax=Rhodocollybia butyracea TaxID=206335 RepID=A0A9P5QBW9_9AGAR|nr:hypothetical protein BDP27DRAFT_1412569 [Rhodocollybia butyracea]